MSFFKKIIKKITDHDDDDSDSEDHARPFEGTVIPDPNFSAGRDAAALQKAIETSSVDVNTIVEVLVKRSNAQRQQIKAAYQQATGKPLEGALKRVLRADFEDVVVGLLMTPAQYDAHELKMAMKGLGTDECVLNEILATRTNAQIREVKKVFKEAYGEELEEDIACDTSGDFKTALLSLCKADRSEEHHIDDGVAKSEAKAMFEAGENKTGTETSVFIDIFTSKSGPQLRKVFKYYARYTQDGLPDALEGELTGDIEDCIMTLVKTAWNTPAYFAAKLNSAVTQGFRAPTGPLTRIIVSRSEIDLKRILLEYKRMYNRPLQEGIVDKTNGDYEKILLALCGRY